MIAELSWAGDRNAVGVFWSRLEGTYEDNTMVRRGPGSRRNIGTDNRQENGGWRER